MAQSQLLLQLTSFWLANNHLQQKTRLKTTLVMYANGLSAMKIILRANSTPGEAFLVQVDDERIKRRDSDVEANVKLETYKTQLNSDTDRNNPLTPTVVILVQL